MPYKSVDELPSGVKDSLPTGAMRIYMAAFNSAFDGDEGKAARIAWAAVKNKYHKNAEGTWVLNAANAAKKSFVGGLKSSFKFNNIVPKKGFSNLNKGRRTRVEAAKLRLLRRRNFVHGEEAGHPFRGNQYGEGEGEGEVAREIKADGDIPSWMSGEGYEHKGVKAFGTDFGFDWKEEGNDEFVKAWDTISSAGYDPVLVRNDDDRYLFAVKYPNNDDLENFDNNDLEKLFGSTDVSVDYEEFEPTDDEDEEE